MGRKRGRGEGWRRKGKWEEAREADQGEKRKVDEGKAMKSIMKY